MRMKIAMGLVFCAAWVSIPQVQAESLTQDIRINIDNPEVMSLTVDTKLIAIHGLSAYNEGMVGEELRALRIVVRSNAPWTLSVLPEDDLRSLENPTSTIPASRLEWRNSGEEYRPLSKITPTVVGRGGPTGENDVELLCDYRIRLRWSDPAGSYTTSIIYTLSAAQ